MPRSGRIQKTNAMRALERAHGAFRPRRYEADERDLSGAPVAEQLGEDPERGLKTLVTATADGDHVVCCIPVARELDLKAAARAGSARGGRSPVGMRRRARTRVDERCADGDQVFISGGRRGIQLELPARDLVTVTDAAVAPICREG